MYKDCIKVPTMNELKKILAEKAKELLMGTKSRRKIELDIVGIDTPHGIYVYDRDRDKWVLIRRNGEAFQPWSDGYYIVYFDNTLCPACRIYDLSWYTFIKLFGKKYENTYYVIILCDWFAQKCRSEAARKSFEKYNIHASPTTLLLYVENGKIVREERIEGAKTVDQLVDLIEEFMSRNKK